MILLIDNYDSFSYNLYPADRVGESRISRSIRNDDVHRRGDRSHAARKRIILSPGPGKPAGRGHLRLRRCSSLAGKIPILGVCLGHQAICEAFGGTVSYAKTADARQTDSDISSVREISRCFGVCRTEIHGGTVSFAGGARGDTSRKLAGYGRSRRTARSWHWSIRQYPVFGVQFHPESILTPTWEKDA